MSWPFKRCPHDAIRCVHGDEINLLSGARAVCTNCGRALKRAPLPATCTVTGKPHLTTNH